MIRRGWVFAVLVATGCATARGTGGSGPPSAGAPVRTSGSVYLDSTLGFQIGRPSDSWQLDATGEVTPDGLSIPVVLRHPESGAQVVLQVVPAVATPTEMAERLTDGLREYPGFSATDPEPLRMREGAVGFAFQMGDQVRGRVAVCEGGRGQMFMMLAAWPRGAEARVAAAVEQIFSSLRPIPRT